MSDEFTYPKRKVNFFVCLFVFSKTEVCREKYYLESKCGIMYACTLNKHKICTNFEGKQGKEEDCTNRCIAAYGGNHHLNQMPL